MASGLSEIGTTKTDITIGGNSSGLGKDLNAIGATVLNSANAIGNVNLDMADKMVQRHIIGGDFKSISLAVLGTIKTELSDPGILQKDHPGRLANIMKEINLIKQS